MINVLWGFTIFSILGLIPFQLGMYDSGGLLDIDSWFFLGWSLLAIPLGLITLGMWLGYFIFGSYIK